MSYPTKSVLTIALLTTAGMANAAPITTGVVASGGYYHNAKVCLDINNNARCDAGEAQTSSDASGSFSLPGNGAAVVAQIIPGTTLFNGTAVTQALTFRAPAAATAVVSAISTELQALIDANASDYNTALAALANRVGVTEAQLLEDFTNEANSSLFGTLSNETSLTEIRIGDAVSDAGSNGNLVQALRNRLALDTIKTLVVIYPENRSFDNLYGNFPGANGLKTAQAKAIKQLDRDGTVLPYLPPAWGGLTAAGQTPVVTQAQTTGVWPNAPFQLDDPSSVAKYGYSTVSANEITRDLYHRFFENQMQIDGGKNDLFAAWGDSGGTVMGYFDGSKTQMWNIAHQYTLADNFFQGAFGGSFLNHQYLICGCVPTVPAATVSSNNMSINVLTNTPVNGVPQLAANASQAASALNSATAFKTGNIAPLDYFGTGDGYRAVNTMQPPYQPSSNAPAAGDTTLQYANPAAATTLPPQTQTHIGDLLNAKNIDWAWYTGSWNTVSTAATSAGHSIPAAPIFQFHHQPFNYFAEFDPVNHAANRTAHLKDRTDLISQAQNGTLPPVVFYKPQGSVNEHPGYTNLADGDAELANVINTLKSSPQWPNMLIVVTYDEFGGQFDHVAPPKADLIGPGTRVPGIIISPYAKKGYVDHSLYDTASILRFITHRYSLTPLNGLNVRDNALIANGNKRVGYFGSAINFYQ
ncbi:acid phosphatase [Methylomonas paludis]|uniref:Acid phosphatase n=1 Tax=Methylomonas paludis TaxID=1173101 RepID=A0A975MKP5_9GAMM|nr:acid phosphatase [Methylomonas paludis]QWF69673.1 acid phosphatase [Methylomonas paludis]